MNPFWKKTVAVLAAAGFALAGCGAADQPAASEQTPKPGDKLKVVATFYPMYEFAQKVAGDYADVTALVPPGVEPHDWEPTPKDIQTIADADVFIYNGGGLEGWVEDALNSTKNEKLKVVETTHGISLMEGSAEEEDEAHGDGHEHGHEHGLDPHVWLDPVLAQQQVQQIEAALVEADPDHREAYEKNAAAYIKELEELDQAFQKMVSSAKRKEFVVQHAAFGYLARQYGLTQVPISGLSPEEDPSPAQLIEIVKFAKEHNVNTIFFETLVSPKVAETVAKEIGAKTAVLNPLEGLTDEERAQNLDYIGVMQKNLQALQAALNE
ncbi:metal ABC transporter substrate-binding protein [Brevibacillus massiliensis]|uniref:metal ABC transporter substrate-binding protein n=1 Tax=Brevibacillus massiliensis TaxID=1118054 RepID=UPI00031443D1|nr:metal ABC transporter substrate-binding protein [Brevibacillus massiliensis]